MKYRNPKMLVLLLFLAVLCSCGQKDKANLLHRVAVLGASVTSGWGVKTPPTEGDISAYPITMQHIMDGMILVPHDDVAFFGDNMFFTQPDVYGETLITELVAHKPTLVIAIDYLFWFAYGNMFGSDDTRLEKFERGLEQLLRIKARILIGDIPDMHDAIGKMLSSSQVPTVETIDKMNIQLREWAKEYPNITVVNVHDLVEDLMFDRQIDVWGNTWPEGSQPKLLQPDMLHPTLEGTVALSLLFGESIRAQGLQTDATILVRKAAANARME